MPEESQADFLIHHIANKNSINEYVVTHVAYPPYTLKSYDEITTLCFKHGCEYIKTVTKLFGVIHLGETVDAECEKCARAKGGDVL